MDANCKQLFNMPAEVVKNGTFRICVEKQTGTLQVEGSEFIASSTDMAIFGLCVLVNYLAGMLDVSANDVIVDIATKLGGLMEDTADGKADE